MWIGLPIDEAFEPRMQSGDASWSVLGRWQSRARRQLLLFRLRWLPRVTKRVGGLPPARPGPVCHDASAWEEQGQGCRRDNRQSMVHASGFGGCRCKDYEHSNLTEYCRYQGPVEAAPLVAMSSPCLASRLHCAAVDQ